MLITFSKGYAEPGIVGKLSAAAMVARTVAEVSAAHYAGNITFDLTWERGRRVRFTLGALDAWAAGSRVAASGRHMRKASWEAHRDVMRALFDVDVNAVIKTAIATYRGRADFEAKHPETARHNVGSLMAPRSIKDCSV